MVKNRDRMSFFFLRGALTDVVETVAHIRRNRGRGGSIATGSGRLNEAARTVIDAQLSVASNDGEAVKLKTIVCFI